MLARLCSLARSLTRSRIARRRPRGVSARGFRTLRRGRHRYVCVRASQLLWTSGVNFSWGSNQDVVSGLCILEEDGTEVKVESKLGSDCYSR